MTQLCQNNLQCPISSGCPLSQAGDFKGVLLPRSIHKENLGNCCCAMELLNQDYSACNYFYCKHVRNNVYKLATLLFRLDSCRYNGYFSIFSFSKFFFFPTGSYFGAGSWQEASETYLSLFKHSSYVGHPALAK